MRKDEKSLEKGLTSYAKTLTIF